MRISGTSSGRPEDGSHSYFEVRYCASDCSAPMPMPATTASTMPSNRARIAAASAGTMKSVYATGASGTIGAIRMPDSPAAAELSIQL